jgi:diguanylate cyclase (GGDEF)-like protein
MAESAFSSMTSDLSEASTEIEKFASKVLQKLIEENVPPIPYYFNVYFSNLLDDQSHEFKKQVLEMTELEESNEAESSLEFEKKLKHSFSLSKELLKHSAMTFKVSSKLKEITDKSIKESQNLATPQATKLLLSNISKNINSLNSTLEKEMIEMKDLYSKNVNTLKDMEKNSIFDSKYGIFNKNHFIKELKKEIKLIEKFKHISSIILVKIEDNIIRNLKTEKSKILVNRTVSKIMLKTSRRTDIVAHLGNGIFGMILRHTDKIGAMKTSERLSDTISSSAVFLEGNEIEVTVHIGISELFDNKDFLKVIECAMQSMDDAQKSQTLYIICED